MANETQFLEFAETSQSFIRGLRDRTESERRIPEPIATRLVESGVCRMALTSDVGGYETDPVVFFQVLEKLAWAEASVAWIVWNNALPCFFARFFSTADKQSLYSDATQLLASSTRASGRAESSDGGFSVSGRWSLVSGCELASWIPVMATVMDGGQPRMAAPGVPETRLLVAPKGAYEILDTWHVTGLRGTGSHDIVIDELTVPEQRTFDWMGPPLASSAYDQLPIFVTMCGGCASIALGLAAAALDGFKEIVSTKVQTDPLPTLKERPHVMELIARSEHTIETARSAVHSGMAVIRDKTFAGDVVTDVDKGRLWRASVIAAEQCKELIRNVHTAAGTPAIYVDSPIERALRDILAVTQHVILQPVHLVNAGMAGLNLPVPSPLF